jgi:hypothetical protein
MVGWFSVRRADFRHVGEAPATFRSSPGAVRAFCPGCGSQITFDDDAYPDEIDVTIATLDDPGAAAPEDHIFTSTQIAWVKLADGLPRYVESRSAGKKQP